MSGPGRREEPGLPFDDSDIKIAPDRPSQVFDLSEGAANAFVREKNNGNMEKARQLGELLAGELTAGTGGIPYFGVGAFDDPQSLSQRRLLYAYVVSRVIEDTAPNSIVAQSALSAFYDRIQREAPEYYEAVTDSAALSLYILAGRSNPEDYAALGRVFARLCGREEGDEVFVRYGAELAIFYSVKCTQAALRMRMVR